MHGSGSRGFSRHMKPEAVIFDMDGTLLDTLADIRGVVNTVLLRHGYSERSLEACRKGVGRGVEHLLRSLLRNVDLDSSWISILAAQVTDLYERLREPAALPYPGIESMLEQLQSAGVPMAVLTNKPQKAAELTAAHFFPDIGFGGVKGSLPGSAAKPEPDSALALAELLGFPPSGVLLVGDSEVDMETGLKVGMQTIGVLWGFRDRETLVRAGAVKLVSSPVEVIDLLLPT